MAMRILAAMAAVGVVNGGCAAVFSERVDSRWKPSQGEPRCNDVSGWIAWDTMSAIGAGVGAGWLFANGRDAQMSGVIDKSTADMVNAEVVGLASLAVLHLVGAVAGSASNDKCKHARAQRDAYLSVDWHVETMPTPAPAPVKPVDPAATFAADTADAPPPPKP